MVLPPLGAALVFAPGWQKTNRSVEEAYLLLKSTGPAAHTWHLHAFYWRDLVLYPLRIKEDGPRSS